MATADDNTDGLRVVLEPDPELSDEDYVKDALGRWNIKVTGYTDYSPAYLFLRDAEGKIRGALLSYVWGKWLHVDTFWLEEGIRRHGWGSKLLDAAHQIGREKGAEAAWLDTFSWQARAFYERFRLRGGVRNAGLPARPQPHLHVQAASLT